MKPKQASKAKLFTGIMYSDEKSYKKAVKALEKKFGQIETESLPYDFTKFTDYYTSEMGKRMIKKFLVFKRMVNRDTLANAKLWTNKLEDKLAKKGKRRVNLDPGYLTLHNIVLASAKDRAHKIYLKNGIYADLTLVFHKKSWEHFPHTFPDFKSREIQDFFFRVRAALKSSAAI